MLEIEKKIINWIEKNFKILFFLVITILGGFIRYIGKDFVSDDMSRCLIPWFNVFKEAGGLSGLSKQIGNYNLFYQTIIAFISNIDMNCIYLYKIISIVFDYLLALSCAYIVCKLLDRGWKKDSFFYLVYTVILMLPTVVLNSAYWGQCDSIYVFFVIWTVYLIYVERYKMGFFMFGIAFAFKLQSIFILPAILLFYVAKKSFSILNFGITIFSFWCSGLVAYFYGRGLLECFSIYFNQANQCHKMYLNVSSFWILFGEDLYDDLHKFAIILTIVLLGAGLYLILEKKKTMDMAENYLNTYCWCVWTVILFLPAMHERYTYMLDIMLIMLCFVNVRYIWCAFVEVLLSILTYSHFLYGAVSVNRTFAIANLLAWAIFSLLIFRENKNPVSSILKNND